MFPDYNALLNSDMSGVNIELPEGVKERMDEFLMSGAQLIAETGVSLYGPDFTLEQLEEVQTLLILYAKQRMQELIIPESEE